jgi:hypothetical protein
MIGRKEIYEGKKNKVKQIKKLQIETEEKKKGRKSTIQKSRK